MKQVVLIILISIAVNPIYGQSKKVLRKQNTEMQLKMDVLKDSIYKLNLKITELDYSLKVWEKEQVKSTENVQTITDNRITSGDSIAHVIQQFFEAETWEKRLDYVLEKDMVRSIFKEIYSTPGSYQPKKVDYYPLKGLYIDIPNETAKLILVEKYNVYVFKKGQNYYVDWFATSGYNEMPLSMFQKESSNEVGRFKVVVKLNNSLYRHNYENAKNTHWSLTISTIKNEKVLYTYVLKDSNAGKFLYEYLKDGETHPFIVDLMFDKTKEKNGKVALITNVIAYGWSYY